MIKPLAGIRVLDFTAFQQGPVGTMILADLGADVIKVEPPDGEPGRKLRQDVSGFSSFFEAQNRGKRSLVIDLRLPAGRDLALNLATRVDVVTENYRRGTMERLGIGCARLREANPRLVYVSASGFGPLGPLAEAPAYDAVAQAMSGLMEAQRPADGSGPVPMLYGLADSLGGLMLSNAVMAALLHRERTGSGLEIDVSILGSTLFVQGVELIESTRMGGLIPMRMRLTPTFGPYEDADGRWFVVGAVAPAHWTPLCAALGREEWSAHPELSRARWRQANADAVEPLLAEAFLARPRAEWIAMLNAAGIPAAPILNYFEVAAHPQARANGYVQAVQLESGEDVTVLGSPLVIEHEPAPVGIAPALGQHSGEILRELGYSEDAIAQLRDGAVIR